MSQRLAECREGKVVDRCGYRRGSMKCLEGVWSTSVVCIGSVLYNNGLDLNLNK